MISSLWHCAFSSGRPALQRELKWQEKNLIKGYASSSDPHLPPTPTHSVSLQDNRPSRANLTSAPFYNPSPTDSNLLTNFRPRLQPKPDQDTAWSSSNEQEHQRIPSNQSTPASSTDQSIISFRDIRAQVLEELRNPDQNCGIKWKRFPGLNKILKGHRSGELSIFTGTTGCGKTTFLSEYSLDLCMQGVPTLWGNFEIKNVRLVKKMLNQFAQKRLESHLDQFDRWANRFEQLPLFFLTFHGEESFDVVLESMEMAVQRYGIRHVIVDNLQFMIGNQCERKHKSNRYFDISKRLDRFAYQDVVIGACRKFATEHDCHVTLVVHPRKEADNEPLHNNSIFGGAKASQEADNVIILQMKWTDQFRFQKYIQITKNRYDGDLGLIPISFSKEAEGFGVRADKEDKRPFHK